MLDRVTDANDERPRWNLLGTISGTLSTSASLIANLVIVFTIAVFLALYRGGLLHLVPLERRERDAEVLDALGSRLWRWLVGQSMSMLTAALLTGTGLWLIGVLSVASDECDPRDSRFDTSMAEPCHRCGRRARTVGGGDASQGTFSTNDQVSARVPATPSGDTVIVRSGPEIGWEHSIEKPAQGGARQVFERAPPRSIAAEPGALQSHENENGWLLDELSHRRADAYLARRNAVAVDDESRSAYRGAVPEGVSGLSRRRR